MAKDVGIQVEGLSKLNSTFRKIGESELPKQVKEANKRAAETVVAAALPNVPVGKSDDKRAGHPGALKKTIRGLGSQRAAYMKGGTAKVLYAKAIHWGTGPRTNKRGPHNIAARPFLWDARERLADAVKKQYEKELDAIIKQVR